MQWIGLTGGIATGKSTVAKLLRDRGLQVIDADEEARRAVSLGSPALHELVGVFGSSILNPDQSLNREALAKIAFNDKESLRKVEEIIHPWVQKSVLEQKQVLRDRGIALAFYDVPLLFEKKLESQFDGVVLVYCKRQLQMERMKKRNNWSEKEILSRLKNQIDIEEKKAKSRWIINNEEGLADLERETERFLQYFKPPRPK